MQGWLTAFTILRSAACSLIHKLPHFWQDDIAVLFGEPVIKFGVKQQAAIGAGLQQSLKGGCRCNPIEGRPQVENREEEIQVFGLVKETEERLGKNR